jgi:hypothetical protein
MRFDARYGHQPLLQQQRKAGWKPHSSSSSVGSSSSNNIGCDFCNMAVEYIKLALHNNQTLEQIEEVGMSVAPLFALLFAKSAEGRFHLCHALVVLAPAVVQCTNANRMCRPLHSLTQDLLIAVCSLWLLMLLFSNSSRRWRLCVTC